MEIITRVENEVLVSAKLLGIMCVTVVERSPHAKGRLLACRLCSKYVSEQGIAFLGKRGVHSFARAFSEESIPENKAVLLEVMLSILVKMNGDIQRLVRLCERNLSERARQLIEERWAKMDRKEPVVDNMSIPESQSLPVLDSMGSENGGPALSSQQTSIAIAPKTGVDIANQEEGTGSVVGTAAVLRARLLKVRERSKLAENYKIVDDAYTRFQEPVQVSGLKLFKDGIDHIQTVVALRPPLDESNPNLLATVECLKQFHAALSKQPAHGIALSGEQLDQLREQVMLQLHEATTTIAR
jgi:hypothetical protein